MKRESDSSDNYYGSDYYYDSDYYYGSDYDDSDYGYYDDSALPSGSPPPVSKSFIDHKMTKDM